MDGEPGMAYEAIYEVIYADPRQPDGRSRALFRMESEATAFAQHHRETEIRCVLVSYEELAALKAAHMLPGY